MKYVIIIFSCLIIGMNFAKAEESCKGAGVLAQLKSECNIVNKGYKNLKKFNKENKTIEQMYKNIRKKD